MKKKIVYKDNIWGDDEPILGRVVKDFLPSPAEFRAARLKAEGAKDFRVAVTRNEANALGKKAKKVGLTPEGLLAGIVHDYLDGKLVLRD